MSGMAPVGWQNFLAEIDSSAVSPRLKTKVRNISSGLAGGAEGEAAEPADATVALDPSSPVGYAGDISSLGPALLGGGDSSAPAAPAAPPPSAAPTYGIAEAAQPRKRISFSETAGGQMAQALLAKRKKLAWWMPEQLANRNERDLSQALDMARLEMGSEEGQERTAQNWANLLADRHKSEAAQTRWASEMQAAADDRAEKIRQFEADQGLRSRGLNLQENELGETKSRNRTQADLERQRLGLEGQRVKIDGERLLAERVARTGGLRPGATHDPTALDPAATGVFGAYGRRLLEDDKAGIPPTPEEVSGKVVAASRAGVLPPMMSTRADRPRIAKDPKTGARYYVYNDGRVEPVK